MARAAAGPPAPLPAAATLRAAPAAVHRGHRPRRAAAGIPMRWRAASASWTAAGRRTRRRKRCVPLAKRSCKRRRRWEGRARRPDPAHPAKCSRALEPLRRRPAVQPLRAGACILPRAPGTVPLDAPGRWHALCISGHRPRRPASGWSSAAVWSTTLVDPRRAESRQSLPLRPARRPRPAGRTPAAGAALPYPHPVALDAGRARAALPELAAGPAIELARATGVPGAHARVAHRDRPGRRDGGVQPVRLLPRAARRAYSVRIRPRAAPRARAVSRVHRGDAGLRQAAGGRAARADADDRLPGRAEPAPAGGDRLPDPHGAGRADARADAGQRLGLVPRLGMAAGAAAAPPRAGRTLRVGLPDPARARREVARRPLGRRSRLHRSACLVRGLSAGRRLGRPGPDLGPARRRGPRAGRLHARALVGGAGQRPGRTRAMHVHPHDDRAARLRGAARHQAVRRHAVDGDRCARPPRRCRPGRRRRAPDAGGRTDLRVDRRPRRRRVEHRGDGPGQASPLRRAARAHGRAAWHPRAAALRAGQVVPGRAAAALVAELVLAQGWPADRRRSVDPRVRGAGRRVRCVARCRRRRRHRRGARAAQWRRVAARPRCAARVRGLRGPLALLASRAGVAGQRRSLRLQARGSDGARAAREGVRARARCAGGLDPSDGPEPGCAPRPHRRAAPAAVAGHPLAVAHAPLLPRAGRLGDRLPAAALLVAMGGAERLSVDPSGRPDAARGAAAAALGPAAGWRGLADSVARRRHEAGRPDDGVAAAGCPGPSVGAHARRGGHGAADRARCRRRAGQRRRGRLRRHRPHRAVHRAARRSALRVHAARGQPRRVPAARRRGRGERQGERPARRLRGLRATTRSATRGAAHHARPGCDRGQRRACVELGRARLAHDRALRRRAPHPSVDREVHARRSPHRHRRRQPCSTRR